MSELTRIGIVGGNGWLGRAMATAMSEAGVVGPAGLTLSKRSDRQDDAEAPGAYWTHDNVELAERSDVIVLSVRPQQFPAVQIDARGKLIISVMAGVPVAKVAQHTNASRVIRAMPNAAASLRKSFTPWFASGQATREDKVVAQSLLSACGAAEEVAEEAHLDYCVGLTGAGAAFPALLAQAMIEAAVAWGLPADFAHRAALGVVADASQLLRADGADPSQIVNEMIEYRGTTAAALLTMRAAVAEAVRAGLEAAAHKAAELNVE